MSLTAEELTDEIRALVGREGASDKGVITDARCARWLNEAQNDIAENCLGLEKLQFDSTTLALSTDDCSYDINDITFGDTTDEGVVDIFGVWHIDGANSIRLEFEPVDDFDELLIDPTSADHSAARPTRWTRRGDNIVVAPRPSSDYNGDPLRVTGQRYPQEFTTNDSTGTELPNADQGLVYYGVAEAWGAIGGVEGKMESIVWRKKYTNPDPVNEDYGWLEKYRNKHSRMEAWDGNILMSDEE